MDSHVLALAQAVNGLIAEVGKLAQMQRDSNTRLNDKISALEAKVAEQGTRLAEQEAKLSEYSLKNQEQLREFAEVKVLTQATHQIAKEVHDKFVNSDGEFYYIITPDIKDNDELAETICELARAQIDATMTKKGESPIPYDSNMSVHNNMQEYMEESANIIAIRCPRQVLKPNSNYSFVFVALFYSMLYLEHEHSFDDVKVWMAGIISKTNASEAEKKLIEDNLNKLCEQMDQYTCVDDADQDD